MKTLKDCETIEQARKIAIELVKEKITGIETYYSIENVKEVAYHLNLSKENAVSHLAVCEDIEKTRLRNEIDIIKDIFDITKEDLK